MDRREFHVVFGAGQIGTPLATTLRDRGHRVRLVRRRGGGPDGVDVRLGDAGDPTFARGALEGATAAYHCMNPPYDRRIWARELPRLMDSLIAAAGAAGARLVVLDNLYFLGRPAGRALSERSPVAPCSHKGRIRASVNARLERAIARREVRAVVARASDFYGPGAVSTYFGDPFWPRALENGAVPAFMRLDTPHSYHYTLDVVSGLATLGGAPEDALGRWWMLPAAPADTTRGMIARMAAALGRPIGIRPVPKLVLRAAALFVPLFREVLEMDYQWNEPFVTDDREFRRRFAADATPLDDGARATVEWARRHYRAS